MISIPAIVFLQDNLTLFQNACRQDFGLQECQLFDIRDLDDLTVRGVLELVEFHFRSIIHFLEGFEKTVIIYVDIYFSNWYNLLISAVFFRTKEEITYETNRKLKNVSWQNF